MLLVGLCFALYNVPPVPGPSVSYIYIPPTPVPKLLLTKSVLESEIEAEKSTRITVLVSNYGTMNLTDVVLYDYLPEEFNSTGAKTIQGRRALTWTFSINIDETKEFSYWVSSGTVGAYTLSAAEASWKNYTWYSKTARLTIKPKPMPPPTLLPSPRAPALPPPKVRITKNVFRLAEDLWKIILIIKNEGAATTEFTLRDTLPSESKIIVEAYPRETAPLTWKLSLEAGQTIYINYTTQTIFKPTDYPSLIGILPLEMKVVMHHIPKQIIPVYVKLAPYSMVAAGALSLTAMSLSMWLAYRRLREKIKT